MGVADVPQANRNRAPPPSVPWTELDPSPGLGGVAAEGAWLGDGGGSWGCQSAPAAAAARTPGLGSHLSRAHR